MIKIFSEQEDRRTKGPVVLWVTLPEDKKGLVVNVFKIKRQKPMVLRSGRQEDLRSRRIDPKLGVLRDRRARGLEDMRSG